MESVNKAIKLRPRSAAFRDTRGNIHAAAGRVKLARVDFEEALRLDPKLTATRAALARLTSPPGQSGERRSFSGSAESGQAKSTTSGAPATTDASNREGSSSRRYATGYKETGSASSKRGASEPYEAKSGPAANDPSAPIAQ